MKNWIAFSLGGALAAGIVWFLMKPSPAPPAAEVESITQQAPPPAAIPPVQEPVPAPTPPAKPKTGKRAALPAMASKPEPIQTSSPKPTSPTPFDPPAVPAQETPLPPSPAPLPAPPPRVARVVTILEGTLIPVRLDEALSSEQNSPGDTFHATLVEPIVIDGLVIAEKGARAEGKVVTADKAGRTKGLAKLAVELVRFYAADGQKINLQTTTFSKDGPTSKKEDATKVGIGAGVGAAIGAIAGGGKGAAIGAGAGGAAGAGVVLATRGKPAELAVETLISFRLSTPVTVTEKLP